MSGFRDVFGLTDAECAARYRALVSEADRLPRMPDRSLGAPGWDAYRRSPLPVGWSTIRPTPASIAKTVAGVQVPTTTVLLAVQGAGGAPQVWTVAVSARSSDAAPTALLAGQFIRMTWTMGGRTSVAEIDVTARGALFPVTADSIRLEMVNETLFPFECDAAVGPWSHTADWRAPRRTVRVTESTTTPTTFVVPAFAQQFQVLRGNANPLGPVQIRDGAAGVLGTLSFGATSESGVFDLPVAASDVVVPVVGAVTIGGERTAFVFRLGF